MEIASDAWLSDIFGYPVFRLDAKTAQIESGDELKRHSERHKRALYYVKFRVEDVARVRSLTRDGFYVVDVNTTFELRKDTSPLQNLSSNIVVCYDAAFHADAMRSAGACFRYSRFHLDPLIPKHIADRVKYEWVRSYVEKKRGDALIVAVKKGVFAGFLAAAFVQDSTRRMAVIELIGVDPAFQGQGVGKALVQEFISVYRTRCDALQVGTQAANIPSMRLYERMGFSIVDTKYVMHMHCGTPQEVL